MAARKQRGVEKGRGKVSPARDLLPPTGSSSSSRGSSLRAERHHRSLPKPQLWTSLRWGARLYVRELWGESRLGPRPTFQEGESLARCSVLARTCVIIVFQSASTEGRFCSECFFPVFIC